MQADNALSVKRQNFAEVIIIYVIIAYCKTVTCDVKKAT